MPFEKQEVHTKAPHNLHLWFALDDVQISQSIPEMELVVMSCKMLEGKPEICYELTISEIE
ncbi:MAG: hypothetical protein GF411_02095 [Candidatus Lokiarchaeota archaeon]|nr:hypothetical protein [Candidatus Lokiarchaeota archaeon]